MRVRASVHAKAYESKRVYVSAFAECTRAHRAKTADAYRVACMHASSLCAAGLEGAMYQRPVDSHNSTSSGRSTPGDWGGDRTISSRT